MGDVSRAQCEATISLLGLVYRCDQHEDTNHAVHQHSFYPHHVNATLTWAAPTGSNEQSS